MSLFRDQDSQMNASDPTEVRAAEVIKAVKEARAAVDVIKAAKEAKAAAEETRVGAEVVLADADFK